MPILRHSPGLALLLALPLTLIPWSAYARGGGHGGGINHPAVGALRTTVSAPPGISAGVPARAANTSARPVGLAARQPAVSPPSATKVGVPTKPTTSPSSSAQNAAAAQSAVDAAAVSSLPAPPELPQAAPAPVIAAPLPELDPIAPLSPQLPTAISSGGSTTSTLALSPGTPSSTPNSTSPSEAAPSAPGGGGKSLADCMGFWDRETHMSKAEWKAACIRTMAEYPTVMGYRQHR